MTQRIIHGVFVNVEVITGYACPCVPGLIELQVLNKWDFLFSFLILFGYLIVDVLFHLIQTYIDGSIELGFVSISGVKVEKTAFPLVLPDDGCCLRSHVNLDVCFICSSVTYFLPMVAYTTILHLSVFVIHVGRVHAHREE